MMPALLRRLLLGLSCVLFVPLGASAQRFAGMGVTDVQAAAFFSDLQHAVANNDRAAVARMTNFPLRVNRARVNHRLVKSAPELVRQYDAVFTPEIRRAILEERLNTLLVNASGIAIQKGVVWLSSSCTRQRPVTCHLGLSSVNQP